MNMETKETINKFMSLPEEVEVTIKINRRDLIDLVVVSDFTIEEIKEQSYEWDREEMPFKSSGMLDNTTLKKFKSNIGLDLSEVISLVEKNTYFVHSNSSGYVEPTIIKDLWDLWESNSPEWIELLRMYPMDNMFKNFKLWVNIQLGYSLKQLLNYDNKDINLGKMSPELRKGTLFNYPKPEYGQLTLITDIVEHIWWEDEGDEVDPKWLSDKEIGEYIKEASDDIFNLYFKYTSTNLEAAREVYRLFYWWVSRNTPISVEQIIDMTNWDLLKSYNKMIL